jgi:hypothetical protein
VYSLSWFTSGIVDLTSTGAVQNTGYTWESDGSAITGAQFWFNDACRSNLGNRISYYTDGMPFLCSCLYFVS